MYCRKYEEMALGKPVSADYELPQVEVDQGWLLRNEILVVCFRLVLCGLLKH
jgi:hypothetical protein